MVSMHQRLKRGKKVNFRTARNDHFCGEMKLANLRSAFLQFVAKWKGRSGKNRSAKGKGMVCWSFFKEML